MESCWRKCFARRSYWWCSRLNRRSKFIYNSFAVAGGANAVGGTINRSIQGETTTAKDVSLDVVTGGGFALAGAGASKLVSKGLDKLSNQSKGILGEFVTGVKYGAKGFKNNGKATVPTGGKTPTGKTQNSLYDHDFENVFTGKKLTVESKFNTSKLTGNQSKAQVNVNTEGGLIINNPTSKGMGSQVKTGITTTGSGVSPQISTNNDD